QKQFFKQNGIPTAAFQLSRNLEEEKDNLPPYPFIQKLRRDGYDGKGVMKIAGPSDLEKAFKEHSIIEEWIDFQQEIAVIVARNDDGDVAAFPMVEMEFNPSANLVEFLISPSILNFETQQKAEDLAKKIAEDLQIVG